MSAVEKATRLAVEGMGLERVEDCECGGGWFAVHGGPVELAVHEQECERAAAEHEQGHR